ncbi:hydrolase [Leptolyngbya sp. 'hensonii']|uniref:HAD family hydrolase n=1 Tax=Leptolyngbya sp. 'hensonii' TaxID=1922337 RepID=UPI00095028AE|nr:HAD family phosphatase [Leptolyngbya sp. 'hensonii']OLP18979.1 hydrolase [Leptolyngbya sp. 'hensonii']
MLQALLFDLDGTLADTDPIHFRTWQDLMRGYGLEIDRPFYKARFSGRLNAQITADLLPQLSEAQRLALSADKEAEFRRRATGELQPLAGVAEVLRWAESQCLKTAVVTNAPVENAAFMLGVLGLADRFDTIVLAEELERGKPDPLPYQVALQRLNLEPQAAIAFEDSPTGVRSAIGAGLRTVGLATTHPPEDLYALGVVLAVQDFTAPDLRQLLQSSCPITRFSEPRSA